MSFKFINSYSIPKAQYAQRISKKRTKNKQKFKQNVIKIVKPNIRSKIYELMENMNFAIY